LKKFDYGKTAEEIHCEHGLSKASLYKWRQRYGGIEGPLVVSSRGNFLTRNNLGAYVSFNRAFLAGGKIVAHFFFFILNI